MWWLGDIVGGWRTIRRRPAAYLNMSLVLGLGIGLATTVFCLADSFLRPLPYPRPTELAVLSIDVGPLAAFGPYPDGPPLGMLEGRGDLFAGVAGYRRASAVRFVQATGTVSVRVAQVTQNFFAILGVRSPWPADQQRLGAGAIPMCLTADGARRVFGTPPAVGTRLLRHGGGVVEIVGVLPPSFIFPSDAPAFPIEGLIPAAVGSGPSSWDERSMAVVGWTLLARMRERVSPAMVQAALSTPTTPYDHVSVSAKSLTSYMTRLGRRLAVGALVAAALLYVLCLANFVNLLLARTIYRGSELAIRTVLGAGRSQLVRLVSVEVVVVVVGAVALGLGIAAWALAASRGAAPAEYLALGQPRLTIRALLVAFGLGLGTLLVGVMAANWLCAHVPKVVVTSGGTLHAGRVRWMRRVMSAAQSATGIILLLGASVLARSYVNLVTQRTGLSGDTVVATASYPDEHSGAVFQADIDRTLDRLRHLPGITAAAAVQGSLVNRTILASVALVRGQAVRVESRAVTPDYFAVVGSRVVAGRGFVSQDGADAALVNETFAQRFFPGGNTVGQPIAASGGLQIVGVVSDMFDVALDRRPEPTVFQRLDNPGGCRPDCNRIHYVLRTARRRPDVSLSAATAIASVKRDAAVVEVTEIRERLLSSVRERAFATLALFSFAATGITVCLSGLVGIVVFVVSRRTSEIAIRMAVGAGSFGVLRAVAGETVLSLAVGIAGGLLVGGWMLTGLARLSYGIRPDDLGTILAATAGMMCAGMIAVLVPARRALRLSPSLALRVE